MVEMIYLTHNNLAKWTAASKKNNSSENIVGVSQDSRKILPGMLYIALEGKIIMDITLLPRYLKKVLLQLY